MEFVCPGCGKWTEIPERQVFTSNRCRCSECWALLLIESQHPFRVRVETAATSKLAANVGRIRTQGGEGHG